jgi:carboxyl-terminal processing protease
LEIAPLSDAQAKGLRVGDRIPGGVAAINGPAGTVANVAVRRCDETTAHLSLRRERWSFPLEHPGFRWSRLRVAPDKVLGYIRIDRFDDDADRLADTAMAELAKTQGIVIDVRANSGGDISALQLVSYFAEGAGPAAALFTRPYLERLGHPVTAADVAKAPRVTGRYHEVYKVLVEGGGGAVWQIVDLGDKRYRSPVVVLIGPETGSAGEGFALAMKVKTHARLIGQPTAGYILSGEDFDVAPGWSLTVPTAGNWSPDGEDLGDKPVSPHETVAETRADLCAGRDRAAERAVAILTGG